MIIPHRIIMALVHLDRGGLVSERLSAKWIYEFLGPRRRIA
jgi:hypothetical protein